MEFCFLPAHPFSISDSFAFGLQEWKAKLGLYPPFPLLSTGRNEQGTKCNNKDTSWNRLITCIKHLILLQEGHTALYLACESQHTAIVELLVTHPYFSAKDKAEVTQASSQIIFFKQE